MARTSNDSSFANMNFGTTNLFSGLTAAVWGFWYKVDSWSTSFQAMFYKDDYPVQVSGWGWQRNSNLDSVVFFNRGHSSFGASTSGIAGSGWHFYSAFYSTTLNTLRIYFDGNLTNFTSALGNPFGNTGNDMIIQMDNSGVSAGPAFIFSGGSSTDEVDALMMTLYKGYMGTFKSPLVPKFFAPLAGRGSTENDLISGLSASCGANSVYAPHPPHTGLRV